MSLFAYHFARRLLHETGWPRKLGLFKGDGYDARVVDAVFAEAIVWAAALGAERPSLAIQMIAELFIDKEWDGEGAPNIRSYVEDLRQQTENPWNTAASPDEAVQLLPVADRTAALSVEQFERLEFKRGMEEPLFQALLWGLDHPDRFEAWYSAHKNESDSMVPLAGKAGVEVDELPSLSEFVENSVQIVRDYERLAEGPLPPIPPRLLVDAKALGWKV
jgi:hypothetical protein